MTKPAKNQQVQQVQQVTTEEVNAMSTQEENNRDVQVVADGITQSPEAAESASLGAAKREKRMSELFKKYGGVDLVSNDSPSFTLEVVFT